MVQECWCVCGGKKHSETRFFSNIFYYNVSPISISGNGLWQSNVIAEVRNFHLRLKADMESITSKVVRPLTTWMIATLTLAPDHTDKGCESLTGNYQTSI